MDEFRLGSVLRSEPHEQEERFGSMNRRKRKTPKGQPAEPVEGDDVVISSKSEEDEESVEDFYTPSDRDGGDGP